MLGSGMTTSNRHMNKTMVIATLIRPQSTRSPDCRGCYKLQVVVIETLLTNTISTSVRASALLWVSPVLDDQFYVEVTESTIPLSTTASLRASPTASQQRPRHTPHHFNFRAAFPSSPPSRVQPLFQIYFLVVLWRTSRRAARLLCLNSGHYPSSSRFPIRSCWKRPMPLIVGFISRKET